MDWLLIIIWGVIFLVFYAIYRLIIYLHDLLTLKKRQQKLVDDFLIRYYSEEKQRDENKAKGDYFERQVSDLYRENGFKVYQEKELDEVYKIDVLAIDTANKTISLVQCKYWNPENGYYIDGNDLGKIYSDMMDGIDYVDENYLNKDEDINEYSIYLELVVFDYGSIDFDSCLGVTRWCRRNNSHLNFGFYDFEDLGDTFGED